MGLCLIFLLRCNKMLIYFEVNIGLLDYMNTGWLQIFGIETFTALEICDYFVHHFTQKEMSPVL